MKRHLLLSILCASALVSLMAIPAKSVPKLVTMEDGSQVTVYQHGDEFFHWTETEDGTWVTENPATGNFHIVPSMTMEQIETTRNSNPRLNATMQQRARRMQSDVSPTEIELNIAPNGLIVLVNFSDKKFSTVVEDIKDMISADRYHYEYKSNNETIVADGSAREYFIAQSMGQYQPQFDVVGPYTLSNTMAYYGSNDTWGQDLHADEMIVEACQMAHDDGIDFSRYDHNDDGNVDFVYVVYAGYGENDGGGVNSIWPHTYWLTMNYYSKHEKVYLDGKLLDTYACCNEKDYGTKRRTGIGTFCHEFSHVLGLPDLYTTNQATHKTMGAWDIMDYGPYNNYSNTPPSYSAYERYFLGWLKPTLLTAKSQSVALYDIQRNAGAIITVEDTCNMKGNDPRPYTFWMLEARSQTGWNTYIPGEGLMLTKVKYSYIKWSGNTVNNIRGAMGVDLVEADGLTPPSTDEANRPGKPGDLFPTGATEYTNIENHSITNIRYEDGVAYFDINGGGEVLFLTDVETITESTPVSKFIKDGQLYIQRGERLYNALGTIIR